MDAEQLRGALVLLSCETEFVAMTEEFRALAARIARASAESGRADVDSVLELKIGGETARSALAGFNQRRSQPAQW
jgi:translation elongation factor EF-Ts